MTDSLVRRIAFVITCIIIVIILVLLYKPGELKSNEVENLEYLMNIRYSGYTSENMEETNDEINDICGNKLSEIIIDGLLRNTEDSSNYIDITDTVTEAMQGYGLGENEIHLDNAIKHGSYGYRVYREDIEDRLVDGYFELQIEDYLTLSAENMNDIKSIQGNSKYNFKAERFEIYDNGIIKCVFVSEDGDNVVNMKAWVNKDGKITEVDNSTSITDNL